MPRKLKPQKVDYVVVSSAQIGVDIMLDRNKLDFFAKLELEEVRAPSAAECRQLARKTFETWVPQQWDEVIRVEVQDISHNWCQRVKRCSEGFTLEFERFERGKKPDGSLIQRPHWKDVEQAVADGTHWKGEERATGGDIGHLGKMCRGEVEIPYSDKAWSQLKGVAKALAAIRKQLDETIKSDSFLKRLLGSNQLGLLKGAADELEER